MTTYTAIANNEIDEDSEITTGLMTKLRDNPVAITEGASGAPKIQTAALEQTGGSEAVTQACIRASAVGQAELKRDTDTCDLVLASQTWGTTRTNIVTLTDPTYYMGMSWSGGGATTNSNAKWDCQYGTSRTGGDGDITTVKYELISTIQHTAASSAPSFSASLDCDYYHIISSPPYNLGDGEIPLFVFARYNANGELVALVTTRTPPWVYNGPTKASPDFYRRGVGHYIKKDIDEDTGEITNTEVEITREIQHADMNIIPHPYRNLDHGDYIVMLDPVETYDLLEYQKSGVRISHLLSGDYLRLDNKDINRAAPQGVITSAFKWRDTQRKAGAMIKDRRLKQGPYAPEVIDG